MAHAFRKRLIKNLIKTANVRFESVVTNTARSNKKPAATVSLSIIGSGSPVELSSVLVSTSNDENYLFNCGEECFRFLNNQNCKISNIKNIFVTQAKWNCIGGVSILSKWIYDITKNLPRYHGPKKLYKCIKRILCLSILSELDFKPIDCNTNKYYEDDTIRIDFIPIRLNNPISTSLRDENDVLIYNCILKEEPDTNRNEIRFLGKRSNEIM